MTRKYTTSYKKTKEHRTNLSNSLKGRNLSEEHKKKLSIAWKNRTVSEKTKEKISKIMKGRKITWGDKISKTQKANYKNGYINPLKGKHLSNKTKLKLSLAKKGKPKPEGFGDIMRVLRQKQILKFGGGPNRGKNENQLLDDLEKYFNIKIIRQFPVSGYFVDGYCKEENIVFEVDERLKNNERDKKREKFIKNKLNCKYISVRDYK